MRFFVTALFLCTSVFAMKTEYLPIQEFNSVFYNRNTNDSISVRANFEENGLISNVELTFKFHSQSVVHTIEKNELQSLHSIFITGFWMIHGEKGDDYKYKLYLDTPKRDVKGVILISKKGEIYTYIEQGVKELNYKPQKNDCRLIELKASFFVNLALGSVSVCKKNNPKKNTLEVRAFDKVYDYYLENENTNVYMCYISLYVVKRNERYCLQLTNAKAFFGVTGDYKIIHM